MTDNVNSPPHYNSTGIECIDYIHQVLGDEGFVAYCRGNMIKYNHRAFHKGKAIEDLKKAEWYNNRANQVLSKLNESV